MELSIVIAIIAVLISVGGLSVTVWATRISRRSLDHAMKAQEQTEEKEFERLRAELLVQITDSRRILDKTRIEIGTIKANFDAEPQPVQVLMGNYTNLFTEYLPKVEASIKQADALWQNVSEGCNDRSYKELMDAKATLYRSLRDDELIYDSGIYMVNIFKAKLEIAKNHVDNATR